MSAGDSGQNTLIKEMSKLYIDQRVIRDFSYMERLYGDSSLLKAFKCQQTRIFYVLSMRTAEAYK